MPIEITSFDESLVWHEVVDGDPAQRWLRQTILDLTKAA